MAVDDVLRQRAIQHFLRKGATKAQAMADELLLSTAHVGFRASLLSSIFYFGKLYCEMYPERMRPVAYQKKTFSPAGYRPEVIQRYHVPVRYPSKAGLVMAQKALMEMTL